MELPTLKIVQTKPSPDVQVGLRSFVANVTVDGTLAP